VTLALAVGGVLVAFIGVPYLVVKHLGAGVLRRGSAREPTIALTFDDGPNPETTPRVLDILARHDVRATFFMVGEAADAHPDLVRRVVAAGHEVGSHGYRHRHALFQRPPLTGFFDTRRAIQRLGRLLGRPTTFFRPPFGAYSWTVLLATRQAGAWPVHWTVESHDWHPRFAPANVVRKVLAEARPGGIIVMHDSGRGAAKTVLALDAVLDGLAALKLRPVLLSRMALRTGMPWSRAQARTPLARTPSDGRTS
jgi:peptidoglycan/xylan/chitin deacetylase (PgdA/CDA1 family)